MTLLRRSYDYIADTLTEASAVVGTVIIEAGQDAGLWYRRAVADKWKRVPMPAPTPPPVPAPTPTGALMWGAYCDLRSMPGAVQGMPPWDMTIQDAYEQRSGKRASIIHWGQPWNSGSADATFETSLYEAVRLRGSVPMINWNPWKGISPDPAWTLSSIYKGLHDNVLVPWAQGCAAWGQTVLIRLMDEMNGRWYPWAEFLNPDGTYYNNNQPGDFIKAYRYIVQKFRSLGANNAKFLFCPNAVSYASDYKSTPLAQLYPGDDVVDYTAMSSYNWGYNPAKGYNLWLPPDAVIGDTYRELMQVAPNKGCIISEIGCTSWSAPGVQDENAKAAWLTNLFAVLPVNYPKVVGLVYFNLSPTNASNGMDWYVESSPQVQAAWKAGISSPMFKAGA